MRKIVYYIAMSIDGYIAGPSNDLTGFTAKGNGVDKYLDDLKHFDTVIMGRKTYEFGYQFGLKPGQKPYPHMRHYIFSETLNFDQDYEGIEICPLDIEIIKSLKEEVGTDIYLCGGSQFAAWLLNYGLIDELRIKLNPHILGQGIKLFGDIEKDVGLVFHGSKSYENGLQIISYSIKN